VSGELKLERVASCQGAAGGVIAYRQRVLFSAVDKGCVISYDPASGECADFRRYTNRVIGLAAAADGLVYAAQSASRRVIAFHPDGRTTLPLDKLNGRFHNHPADVSVDSTGRVWFSDPFSPIPSTGAQVHGKLDFAAVLRLQRNARREWQMTRMTYDSEHPYGVQVAADESALFVTETDPSPRGRHELRSYPIAPDGTLGQHRVLHTFGAYRGGYGMCLNGENLLVCAGDGASGPGPLIYCFTPAGRVLATIAVPAAPVSCAVLGNDLYVTTADGGLYRGPGFHA
jgi:gluconolactonase